MSGVDQEVLLARAYLSRVAEPATLAVWVLVCEVGPIEAAERIRRGEVGPELAHQTEARARRAEVHAEDDLAAAERHGIRLLVPESADWPAPALASLERTGSDSLGMWQTGSRRLAKNGELIPPLALWVQGAGSLAGLGQRAAAVVGARSATAYGNWVAGEYAFGMAHHGVDIISGGAYGIDAAAHRGALAAGGRTVLVSAGGLDRPYPSGNAGLFERVREHGVLVSESPPGAAPARLRFLSRNRLIAAFAQTTVIVEAARRSGAINTANHALNLGKPLLAVPGPITSAMSAGCHDLITRGDATLAGRMEDVLEQAGRIGDFLPLEDPEQQGKRMTVLDDLSDGARRVFDALPARRAVSIDELSFLAGLPVGDILGALPILERHGIVDVTRDGYRARPIRTAR